MKQPEWSPTPQATDAAAISAFARWLTDHGAPDFPPPVDYAALYAWTAAQPAAFWGGLARFYDVEFATPATTVLSGEGITDAVWFSGATLNFADRLSLGKDDQPAVIIAYEDGPDEHHTYAQLRRDVGALSAHLTRVGVRPGDRVVGYLPNCYEGVVAVFATASIGAIWSQTGIDYNAPAASDRLGQLDPKVLITGTGYVFRGVAVDRTTQARELAELLGTVTHTIVVPTLSGGGVGLSGEYWADAIASEPNAVFSPNAVRFDHPLWVLFTSGTTGKPKGIVHGHGGVLLGQLKDVGLHLDLAEGERLFWYTTPNWMMWNVQISSLLFGATAVLYVGDPLYPSAAQLWELVDRLEIQVFGTSPGQILATEAAGVPVPECPRLRIIPSTGSPLPARANAWVRGIFDNRVPVVSVSGGTDIVGCFVGGSPVTPVWDGEISARTLGVPAEVWDDAGVPVVGQEGELVITGPLPSMPVSFWNDADGSRYRAAYFETFPGVWRQGDWATVTERGTIIMHGRSDATLNRKGVRLGSAEMYAAVESLAEVADALVVGVELPDGGYWMPMFVVATDGWIAGESEARLRDAVAERASKQHVPDEVVLVPRVPRTRTGKKMEVPIKRILLGADAASIGALDATDDPDALLWFADYAKTRIGGGAPAA